MQAGALSADGEKEELRQSVRQLMSERDSAQLAAQQHQQNSQQILREMEGVQERERKLVREVRYQPNAGGFPIAGSVVENRPRIGGGMPTLCPQLKISFCIYYACIRYELV